jgi:long-chain acyl-CoA synthetase
MHDADCPPAHTVVSRLRWLRDSRYQFLCQTSRVEQPKSTAISARPPFTNVAELVAVQAAQRPETCAIIEPGTVRRTRSWSELDTQITAVAAGLLAHGLVAGHRVALLGTNSIEFVVAYLAALRAGYVAVPMNTQSTAEDVHAMLHDCGARVIFVSPDHQLSSSDFGGVHLVPLSQEGIGALAGIGHGEVTSPQDREALAVLFYTAGTSGRPKAAMLTHRALLSHLEQVGTFAIIDPETTIIAVLPLFHVYGLNAVLGGWLYGGARLLVVDGMTDAFFDIVRDEGVTNLPVSPAVLAQILASDRLVDGLGDVATVVSGAAPLGEDLRLTFTERTGLRVDQGYGLTEAASGVSATLGGPLLGHGHVGRPLPGVEIRIGDGSEPGEPGEIFTRGDNLFSGYWPSGKGGPDAEGWFGTGDVGYLSRGDLFLVDRSRELIIVNGFNVYPAEVEQAIAELPEVDSVAVVGRPDLLTGEQVVAFVTGSAITVDAVEAHCMVRLAKFKRPRVVKIVEELPRGATGKVQKGVLRHRLLDALPVPAVGD